MRKLLLLLFFSFYGFAQHYPQNYFRPPLDIPLDISGSFAELRTNHFHSGLDFKTQKKERLPVYAVADGYVSRIKISTFGFGKAIYISHPNGYTTVYAHLSKANDKIESLIKEKHYKEKSFEIEMFYKPNEIPVKKDEIIAFSGNTGGSGGPHLHFEIRDSKTEKIINPLLFGIDNLPKDVYTPIVNSVLAYPIDTDVFVNNHNSPQLISLTKNAADNYVSEKVYANGKIGFGINTYDKTTNPWNFNGVYKIHTFLNGVPYFAITFDTFSFDESKHINNYIDFYRFKKFKQRIQRLFFNTPYPLSLVADSPKNGIINVQPSATYIYKIVVEDFEKNTTTIEIPIVYKEKTKTISLENKKGFAIKNNKEYVFEKENISVTFNENTFYEDFFMNFDVKDSVLYLHTDEVPVKNKYTVSFDISNLTATQKAKSFIAELDKGKLHYNYSYLKNNILSAKLKNLGAFMVVQDTVSPKIYGINFKKEANLDNYKSIQIKISDTLSGIKSYNAYLNNNWILMEYDYKTNLLTHNLTDNIYVKGINYFKLIVEDNTNNSSTFETTFYKNN